MNMRQSRVLRKMRGGEVAVAVKLVLNQSLVVQLLVRRLLKEKGNELYTY